MYKFEPILVHVLKKVYNRISPRPAESSISPFQVVKNVLIESFVISFEGSGGLGFCC